MDMGTMASASVSKNDFTLCRPTSEIFERIVRDGRRVYHFENGTHRGPSSSAFEDTRRATHIRPKQKRPIRRSFVPSLILSFSNMRAGARDSSMSVQMASAVGRPAGEDRAGTAPGFERSG